MKYKQFSFVGKFLRFGVLPACLLLGAAHLPSASVLAATPPPPPAASACDPDYYDTLEARAWLEAQREIVQNQNLIVKPDSVLQYTCFDKHLGAIDNATRQMFSHESAPTGISGLGALGGGASGILGDAVGGALGGIGEIMRDLNVAGDALGIEGIQGLEGKLNEFLAENNLNVGIVNDLLEGNFDFETVTDAIEEGLDIEGLSEMISSGDVDINKLKELAKENVDFGVFSKLADEDFDFNKLGTLASTELSSLAGNIGTSVGELRKIITANGTTALNGLKGLSGVVSPGAMGKLGEAAKNGTDLKKITSFKDLVANAKTVGSGVRNAAGVVTNATNQVNQVRDTVTGAANNVVGAATGAAGGVTNTPGIQAVVNTFQSGAGLYNRVADLDTSASGIWDFFRNRNNDSNSGNGSSSNSSGSSSQPGQGTAAASARDLATGGTTASATQSSSGGGSGGATAIAADSASNFILSNYTSSTTTMLGGRTDISYQPTGAAPAAYSCNVMDAVWKQARCSDFIDVPATDGFFTLSEYASPGSQDKRFPLGSCGKTAPWGTAYSNAFDKERNTTTNTGPKWTRDGVETYLELFKNEAGATCADSKIIATGIVMQQKNAQPSVYNQKMCLMPGCDYIPTAEDAGECKAFEG